MRQRRAVAPLARKLHSERGAQGLEPGPESELPALAYGKPGLGERRQHPGGLRQAEPVAEPFGFESTWSGRSRPQVVRNAGGQGYETHGIFLGTAHAALNIARVLRRVLEGGHRVPEREIVRRWSAAFENLLAMWNVFDRIYVLDSSADTVRLVAWKEAQRTHAPGNEMPVWAARIAARVETRVQNRNG